MRCEKSVTDEDCDQKHRDEITQNLMGPQLHCVKTAAKRIQNRSIAPEIRKGLGDDANARRQFPFGLSVWLLDANRFGNINRAQPLFYHCGGDYEVATSIVV